MSEPTPSVPPVSVVLAGGGSAGHTSPLIATAEQLRVLAPGVRLTAVGTARGLETHTVPAAGLPLELIPPVPMPRRPGPDLLAVPGRLRRAVADAAAVLRRVEADVVLGFGGYVSTPVYLAARRLRVPIVIHEQNAVPGLANRLAARFTEHVATSFPDTPLPHARHLGLPLRTAITALADPGLDRAALRRETRADWGFRDDQPLLLVTGGSQGARSINTAVLGAKEQLLARGIQVLHVLGGKNVTAADVEVVDPGTGAAYRPVGYVDGMERAYAAADLVLCRSGASTVLETAVAGLPALFVPYPVGNGEQAKNAVAVVRVGGGRLLPDADCTAERLTDLVPGLITDREQLAAMATATRSVAVVDAAERLARLTLEVAAGGTPGRRTTTGNTEGER